MGCMVHLLQLLVRKFEKENSRKATINSAIMVVNKYYFKRLSKVTRELKWMTKGKVVRSHCLTRWSSLFLMIERLLELKDYIIQVCLLRDKDSLQTSQWNNLNQIKYSYYSHSRFVHKNGK